MSTSLRLFVLTISLFLASLPAAVKADLEKQYDQERTYSKMGVIACNYLFDKSQWTDPFRGSVYIDKEGRVFFAQDHITDLSDGGDSCSSIKSLDDIVSMQGFYNDGLPTIKVEGVDSHFIWLGKTHTFRIRRFKPFTIHFSDIPPEYNYYEVKVQAVLEAQKLTLYYQDYQGRLKKRDEFLKVR